MTGLEALKTIYSLAEKLTITYSPELLSYLEELKKVIEKELKQPQEFYKQIKEIRDKKRLIRDEHQRKQDISYGEKIEMLTEICTYNDVLKLLENTFEIDLLEVYKK